MLRRHKYNPVDLRQAVAKGNYYLVKGLLEINIKQEPDIYGNTPLHIAVFYGHVEIVKLLLKSKADPGVCNIENMTPIQLVLFHNTENSFKITEAFAEYPTDETDSYKYGAALIFLVHHKQYKRAIALLKAGADPNKYGLKADNSAVLHVAIEHFLEERDKSSEILELIALLLEKGANRAAVKKISAQEYTALELAAYNYQDDILKLFAKSPAAEDDKRLYDFDAYKLFIIQNCIEELRDYQKKLIKLHGQRAESLLEGIEPIYAELKDKMKIDVSRFFDIIDQAVKAFNSSKPKVIGQLAPYYAQPPQNQKKDSYNDIIEKYQKKLKIFTPKNENQLVNFEEKPSSPSPVFLNMNQFSSKIDERMIEMQTSSSLKNLSVFKYSQQSQQEELPAVSLKMKMGPSHGD